MPPQAAAELTSKDGNSGLIVAGITGGENDAQNTRRRCPTNVVHDRDGVTVRAGGVAMVYAQINEQTERDLLLMESIAIPLSFLVLVWVFGGLVAAALPMVVGGMAIVGSMSVLRLITFGTDVSIFALNLSTALGLALAIDYTLLIISRYRDELADGAPRDQALIRTMATAGRTVLFSATTVALSMAAMLMFPMYFLKSFAYAGVATVGVRRRRRGVVTPAAIWLLGDRLDGARRPPTVAPAVPPRPSPRRSPSSRSSGTAPPRSVMRHAIPVGLAVVVLLLRARRTVPRRQVGLPRRPGAAHVRVGAPGRRPAARRLRRRLVDRGDRRRPRRRRARTGRARALRRRAVARCPTSPRCRRPTGTSSAARRSARRPPPTGVADGSAFLTVGSTAPLFSDASEAQLDALHAVAGPGGRDVAAGAASRRSTATACEAITTRLPWVLGLIAVITFGLLFLLTGSVVLPLKAVAAEHPFVDRGVRRAGVDLPGRPSRARWAPRRPARWSPTCRCCCSASPSGCRWTTRSSWSPASGSTGWG